MAYHPIELTTFEIDTHLRHIAALRLGLVTTSAAARVGVNAQALARRRRTGALVQMHVGVMRVASAAPSEAQRMLAASLAVPGSTISAVSAAVVHQMPIPIEASRGLPMVTVPHGRSPRAAGVTVVRSAAPLPSRAWHTSRLAAPAAALLLLPRFVDATTVERCLDHAIAQRILSVRSVRALVERFPARAVHRRQLLLALLDARSDGLGHRSRLEQTVRGWLDDAQLAGWRGNHLVPVGGGEFVEVDFAWTANKVALEVSPFVTHGSRAKQERDVERRRKLTEQGWRVVEASDPDLDHQRAFIDCARSLRVLLAS